MPRNRDRSRKRQLGYMLLSAEDAEETERSVLALSPKFRAIIRTAEQEIRTGEGITHDDFWLEAEQDWNNLG